MLPECSNKSNISAMCVTFVQIIIIYYNVTNAVYSCIGYSQCKKMQFNSMVVSEWTQTDLVFCDYTVGF